MTFYVTNQNIVVLSLFLLGANLGLLYDLLRLKRMFFQPSRISMFVGDLFFWLLVTALFLFTIQVTNYGYVRWYEFVSAGFGFLLYRMTFSRIVLTALRAVVKGAVWLVRLFLQPFCRFAEFLISVIETSTVCVRSGFRLKAVRRYSRRRIRKDITDIGKGVIA